MNRILTLDGWRGIAVSAVILSHVIILATGNRATNEIAIALGAQGVTCFFAISGFLITTLLLREMEAGGLSLRGFYTRRTFRILPPAFAYLAILWVFNLAHMFPTPTSEMLAGALFFSNYWPATSWFVGHFWSLSVEEHFYLLWPVILSLGVRRASRIAAAVIVLELIWRPFGYAVLPWVNPAHRTDMRLDAFAYAGLAAILVRQGGLRWLKPSWTIPANIVVQAALYVAITHWHGATVWKETVITPLMTALVISTVQQPRALLSQLLEFEPLKWIGRISYSLYLWQQLTLSWLIPAPIVVKLALCVGVAYASYRLLEQPLTSIGRRLSGRVQSPRGHPVTVVS